MWKPGSDQPSKMVVHNQQQQQQQQQVTRHPNSSNNNKDDREAESRRAKPPNEEPLRTKALSGATRNMRFMRRREEAAATTGGPPPQPSLSSGGGRAANSNKNNSTLPNRYTQKPSQHLSNPPSPRTTKEVPSTSLSQRRDGVSRNSSSSSRIPANSMAASNDSHMDVDESSDDESVHYEVATPIDMFGRELDLLGRRSFGKFDPNVERTWKLHKQGESSIDDDNTKYENRNRQRHNSHDNKSPRPIGNLNQIGKGKKRKTMISDV